MAAERKSEPAIIVARADDYRGARLDDTVRDLVRDVDLDALVGGDLPFFEIFMARLNQVLKGAFGRRQDRALLEAHKSLYLLYEQSFASPSNPQAVNQFHPFLLRIRNDIERAWEESETARASLRPEDVPGEPAAFSAYFLERCLHHRLRRHPLFDFLELNATREDVISFFLHDRALILRFCDLVSLAMIGADDEVRGELAANLWDEMGNGDPALRHTVLFRRLLNYIGCDGKLDGSSTEPHIGIHDWQGFAGYNLHLFFSLHRRNYFKSVGCLGSAEFMDGDQYTKILRGCARVGLDDEEKLAYYASHVTIDAQHGETWLANVLVPLVIKYPGAGYQIMLGAEMRLNVTADYYDSILRKLAAPPRTRVPEWQSSPVFESLVEKG